MAEPALFFCLAISAAVIGPFFTTYSADDYFSFTDTQNYIAANLSFTDMLWYLPGVFSDSEFGLNGSLWTMPTEVRLYVAVLAIYLIGAFRTKATATIAIILAAYFIVRHSSFDLTQHQVLRILMYAFAAGSLAYIHRTSIPIKLSGAVALGVLVIVLWATPLKQVAVYAAAAYLCVYLFTLPAVCRFSLPGDYSYGVYIYGFAFQQIFHHFAPAASPLANALVCMIAALAVGAASWHLVERSCLNFAAAAAKWVRNADQTGFSLALLRPYRGGLAAALVLAAVSQAPLLLDNITTKSSDLTVLSVGPAPITHGQPFNVQPSGLSAIWINVSHRVDRDSTVFLGGVPLQTNAEAGTLLAVGVPAELFARAGKVPLVVVETVGNQRLGSRPFDWIVE